MLILEEKDHIKLFAIYICISIAVFACLTFIHSYITHNQIQLVNFFVPISASAIVGFLLARNKILHSKLKTLASTDKLTNTCNRQYFDRRLAEESLLSMRYKQTFSIIFFDLDFFKKVNDNYGHAVGDQVLIEFSAIIRKMNRDTDLFARYGGEEFVLLAKMADKNTAKEIYLRIKKVIGNHTFGKAGHVTFSAGIAQFDYNTDSVESIMKRADKALYDAKGNGRNQAVMAD